MDTCASCTRHKDDPWGNAKGFYKCGFCNKIQHVECTTGFNSITADNLGKINNTLSPLIFKCVTCAKAFSKQHIQSMLHDMDKFRRDTKAEIGKEVTVLKQKYNDAASQGKVALDKLAQARRDLEVYTERHATEQRTLNDTITVKNAKLREIQNQVDELTAANTELEKSNTEKISELVGLHHIVGELKEKISQFENEDPSNTDLVVLNQELSSLKANLQEQGDRNSQQEDIIAQLNAQIHELSTNAIHVNAPATLDAMFKNFEQKFNMLDQKFNALQNTITSRNFDTYARVAAMNLPTSTPVQHQAITQPQTNASDDSNNQVSFAMAMHHSKTPIDCIRNIVLLGDSATVERTYERIVNDKANQQFKFTSISRHSPQSITVKYADTVSALAFDAHLQQHYKDLVEVKIPDAKIPSIKITNIRSNFTSIADLEETIKKQNPWIEHATFEIVDFFPVSNSARTYHNAIMTCDLESHTLILQKTSLIIGMQQCRIFEHINLIQCSHCNKYGHFWRNCTLPPHCRRCNLAHPTKLCNDRIQPPVCTNCLTANASGKNFNTHHASTDDRCPVRIERIAALKVFHQSKN